MILFVITARSLKLPAVSIVCRWRDSSAHYRYSLGNALKRHMPLCAFWVIIEQQGSKVEPDVLRLTITNPSALAAEDIAAIEGWVNDQIIAGHPVVTELLTIDEAKPGAKALFGEKYGASTHGEHGWRRCLN